MMLEVGITGGIGSGKSTVARAFEALGYKVYYADDRAKALYNEDQGLKAQVKALFGADTYNSEGVLDRSKMAERVFGDKALLAQLNALVHPIVIQDYAHWLRDIPGDYQLPFVLKEAAILFEAGTYVSMESVIMVYAPLQVRIARVMQRDGLTAAQVQARHANQWPDSIKLQRADFIIYNDGEHALPPQIAAAIRHFGKV